MEEIHVPIQIDEDTLVPKYGSEEAAGADVHAHIEEDWVINPGEARLIPTGIRFEIPFGYEMQIRPRSGLALKHQITVLNSPGTIDSDYRGEVQVILMNLGKAPFVITPKMRIAQLVFAPVLKAVFLPKKELSTTSRGEGGFGHTGV